MSHHHVLSLTPQCHVITFFPFSFFSFSNENRRRRRRPCCATTTNHHNRAIQPLLILPTSTFFGSLVVLVHILKFLFAFLGASTIPKVCHFPDAQGEDKMKKKKKKETRVLSLGLSYLIKFSWRAKDKKQGEHAINIK